MSELNQTIRAHLSATPIRTLTDRELARELTALRAIRAGLLPVSKAPAAATVASVPVSPRVSHFERVPLSKGSLFSRRVPVLESARQQPTAAAPAAAKGPTRAEQAQALEQAARAAGVEPTLWATYRLRLTLLETAQVTRARGHEHPAARVRSSRRTPR